MSTIVPTSISAKFGGSKQATVSRRRDGTVYVRIKDGEEEAFLEESELRHVAELAAWMRANA